MTYWDRPDAQAALAARHADRVILNEARAERVAELEAAIAAKQREVRLTAWRRDATSAADRAQYDERPNEADPESPEQPTAYVVAGEHCGLTGPYRTREEAEREADAMDADFGCPPHEVFPMYAGWYEPIAPLARRDLDPKEGMR